MNVKQVRANTKKVEEMTSSTITTDPEGTKVLIVSCNSFVSDFLRGLVQAHGYETQEVLDFYEAQVQVENGWPDVVFIDDSCLEMEHTEKFELRAQNLIQKGVPIILLANEHTKQHVEQIPTMKFLKVVEKPVGYLQIGQVMADLANV